MRSVVFVILLLLLPFGCQDTKQLGESPELLDVEPQQLAPANPLLPSEEQTAEAVNRLDQFFKRRSKYNGFNGTVLYAVNGEIEYAEAFGFKNLRKKDSLELASSFQLASVSKPITAIATLLLVQEGKLALEDSIQKFYPEFPYQGITIQHLLNHRSGLPNYMYFADSVWLNKEEAITNRDVMELLTLHHPRRYYPPNRRYNYSNTNYAILALLIEDLSKMSFELFLKTKIFLPTGMHDSSVYNKSKNPANYHAVVGYSRGRRIAENTYLNGVVGDKGIYSSVKDLFLLDQALRQGSLISLELQERAFEAQHKDLYKWDNYGLGWRIDASMEENKVVYHTGWWKGFRSYFIRELGSEKTLIILSNTSRTSSIGTRELRKLI